MFFVSENGLAWVELGGSAGPLAAAPIEGSRRRKVTRTYAPKLPQESVFPIVADAPFVIFLHLANGPSLSPGPAGPATGTLPLHTHTHANSFMYATMFWRCLSLYEFEPPNASTVNRTVLVCFAGVLWQGGKDECSFRSAEMHFLGSGEEEETVVWEQPWLQPTRCNIMLSQHLLAKVRKTETDQLTN